VQAVGVDPELSRWKPRHNEASTFPSLWYRKE
jgi:hypothetical protein